MKEGSSPDSSLGIESVHVGSGHWEQLKLQPEKTGFLLSTLKVSPGSGYSL